MVRTSFGDCEHLRHVVGGVCPDFRCAFPARIKHGCVAVATNGGVTRRGGGLTGATDIRKSTFSCCGAPAFQSLLNQLDPHTVILAGIEAHICVYQTALDLLAVGREVWVAADATASRVPEYRDYAFDMLRAKGVVVMPVESILLHALGDAADPRFKKILPLLKG